MPAHITVLFPFVEPQELAAQDLVSLSAIAASMTSFHFRLASVGRFADAVYLAPQPAEPFIELVRNVRAAFPGYPPYAGRHTSVVPHLTVAHGESSAHGAVESHLHGVMADIAKVQCRCRTLVLIENTTGRWRTLRSFELPQERNAG